MREINFVSRGQHLTVWKLPRRRCHAKISRIGREPISKYSNTLTALLHPTVARVCAVVVRAVENKRLHTRLHQRKCRNSVWFHIAHRDDDELVTDDGHIEEADVFCSGVRSEERRVGKWWCGRSG